jgi:hypothetical protein
MCCDETIKNESKAGLDCCCSEMTDEEKLKWMHGMHHKMHHLKAHGGHMMGKMHGKGLTGHMPGDMCKEMMSAIHHSHKVATLATPEVQGLFEDWVEQIEKEILDYLKDKEKLDIKDLSGEFKISKDSAYFFLTKLAQKGKIDLNIIKK